MDSCYMTTVRCSRQMKTVVQHANNFIVHHRDLIPLRQTIIDAITWNSGKAILLNVTQQQLHSNNQCTSKLLHLSVINVVPETKNDNFLSN